MGSLLSRLKGIAAIAWKTTLAVIRRYILQNEYLVGLIIYAGGQSVAELVQSLYSNISNFFTRNFFTTIRLRDSERSELMAWLRSQRSAMNTSDLDLIVNNSGGLDSESQGIDAGHLVDVSRTFQYEPELTSNIRISFYSKSAGYNWIWIGNYTYAATPTQDSKVSTSVSLFGRNKLALEEILNEGRAILRKKMQRFLHVITVYNFSENEYGLGWNVGFENDRKQRGRSIDSVILPKIKYRGVLQDQASVVLEDAKEFLRSEEWYAERGIPYRRGYLLHGLPGTGKSSLVSAVASELQMPIYLLQLSYELMDDEALQRLLQTMNTTPSILLLEDVDAACSAVEERGISLTDDGAILTPEAKREDNGNDDVDDLRSESPPLPSMSSNASSCASNSSGNLAEFGEIHVSEERRPNSAQSRVGQRNDVTTRAVLHLLKKADGSKTSKVSLSGLLNCLDGPTATAGRLLFMTTNCRDRLDPALTRPGRIDLELSFSHCDEDQSCRLFQRFYGNHSNGELQWAQRTLDSLSKKFASTVMRCGRKFTTADIQGHLMKYKTSPQNALDNFVDEMTR